MAWSKQRLLEVTGERVAKRDKLKPVEKAALCYARWQGMTDEVGIDRDKQKVLLDKTLDALDKMDGSAWDGMVELADELGEPALKGLMRYSLQRSAQQLREQIALTETSVPSEVPKAESPAPKPAPKKRLRRMFRM